jgi:hypothetical protein
MEDLIEMNHSQKNTQTDNRYEIFDLNDKFRADVLV